MVAWDCRSLSWLLVAHKLSQLPLAQDCAARKMVIEDVEKKKQCRHG